MAGNEKDNGTGPAPMTERESAILDWMFRNTHACPFDDESGLDFEAICTGFGTEGCKACILDNISKLGQKGN